MKNASTALSLAALALSQGLQMTSRSDGSIRLRKPGKAGSHRASVARKRKRKLQTAARTLQRRLARA